MISTFTAIFDANVFYGARLRSLMLFAAQSGTFRARWTEEIHAEWMSKLLQRRPDIDPVRLHKTRELMDRSVPDCLVTGYEPFTQTLTLPDPKDRHVLAAAIKVGAAAIVTFNSPDFPAEVLSQYGIDAKTPDDFLQDLANLHPTSVLAAVSNDIQHYKDPPLSIDEYLEDLRKAGVPQFAEFLNKVRVAIDDRNGG